MDKQILFNKENVRLLSCCCTWKRPQHLKEMLDTFYETKSEGTEIFIYLHNDDPHIQEYMSIVKNQNYAILEHRDLFQAINYIVFDLFPNLPYYQTIVDDMRYRTKTWDTKLIEALNKVNDIGTASPRTISDENWNRYQHPSAEVYSWKFVNTIGYVYPREYRGHGADYYFKDLCKALNGLVYVSEVHIEHLWFGGGRPALDKVTEESYSQENIKYGENVYKNWVQKDRNRIISLFRK